MPTFTRRSRIDVPAQALFDWHNHRGAFERLAPPWQPVRLERFEGIRDGQRAVIKLGPKPAALAWIAEHRDYIEGRQFRDIQVKGPFARWEHTHRTIPEDDTTSVLEDDVAYRLPFAPLSQPLGGKLAERQFERMFAYRHRVTREDLSRHHAAALPSLRIAITGSTGLLGEALVAFLTTGGHNVVRLVRTRDVVARYADRADERAAYWDPDQGEIDAAALEGVDAVLHLAGESVFGLRWSPAKKRRILESRMRGTRLLSETLAALEHPPPVFLSASASGYYGDHGASIVTESTPSGDGFLAEVCREWEAATSAAEAAGIRTAILRIGVVLTPAGGALGLALPAFLAGLGGTVGNGNTYFPWIALDDVLYAVLHLLSDSSLSGPFNLSAPEPVTQQAFAKTLGRVVRRPTPWRIPSSLVRRVAGEAGEEMMLKSTRMQPEALLSSGFRFAYPELESALRHLLGRSSS